MYVTFANKLGVLKQVKPCACVPARRYFVSYVSARGGACAPTCYRVAEVDHHPLNVCVHVYAAPE
eukprot:1066646-Pleurochrysis_carterae.AAC.2